MKRDVNKTGICGIASLPSYPTVAKGKPLPVPPLTPPSSRPALPCNCTETCTHTCSQFGMTCCGNGIDCDCSSLSSCPKCGPPPSPPYAACGAGCKECVTTVGVPGNICSSKTPCSGKGAKPCPVAPVTKRSTAVGYCFYCMTSKPAWMTTSGSYCSSGAGAGAGAGSGGAGKPSICALICEASATKAPWGQDGCPVGATCKSLTLDKDPCETGHITAPCNAKKNCGICTYP